jgi:hypothetical protein
MDAKKILLLLILLITVAVLGVGGIAILGNKTNTAQSLPDDFTITMRRTSCYGFCPVYSVTITSDGQVTYTGEGNVTTTGTQTRTVDKSQVLKLYQKTEEIRFFELEDEYVEMITDLPTTFVTVKANGKTKMVEDYAGAPEDLKELETLIDDVVGTAEWIKTNQTSTSQEITSPDDTQLP